MPAISVFQCVLLYVPQPTYNVLYVVVLVVCLTAWTSCQHIFSSVSFSHISTPLSLRLCLVKVLEGGQLVEPVLGGEGVLPHQARHRRGGH